MASYDVFSLYYDKLTSNISYAERAAYFDKIIKQNISHTDLLLDLACGTGSLSVELNKLGYDVIGVDASSEMLSCAVQKNCDNNLNIMYLCQNMMDLDLYGTVDVTICALDSINHIIDEEQLSIVFNKISLFTNIGGLFIFDVNTEYKHRNILADNAFVFETDDVFCVWQNYYNEKTGLVSINLDFFRKNKNYYVRTSESFYEKTYSFELLNNMLEKSGFDILAIYEGDTFDAVKANTERAVYVAKKVR